MIEQKDLEVIKNAVLANTATKDHELAIALMNLGLHVLSNFDRATVALETIAKGGVIEFKIGDTKEQFESVVVDTVQKMIRNRTITL